MNDFPSSLAGLDATITLIREIRPAYHEQSLRDIDWCVAELAGMRCSVNLLAMTRDYARAKQKISKSMISDKLLTPAPYSIRLWHPEKNFRPCMHLASTAAGAVLLGLLDVLVQTVPGENANTAGQDRAVLAEKSAEVAKWWDSLAQEFAEFGVDCTGRQVSSIEWCCNMLDGFGYSFGCESVTWDLFLNKRRALGAGDYLPETFATPPISYQLWGPRYPERGSHSSPFAPRVAMAAAVALLNIARMEWRDRAKNTARMPTALH